MNIFFWQQHNYLLNFKNRIKLTQTIGLVKGDPDKWVNPEKLQLDISSLEGFPFPIHQLFNPDAVNLDWKKRNRILQLTTIIFNCFSKQEEKYLISPSGHVTFDRYINTNETPVIINPFTMAAKGAIYFVTRAIVTFPLMTISAFAWKSTWYFNNVYIIIQFSVSRIAWPCYS